MAAWQNATQFVADVDGFEAHIACSGSLKSAQVIPCINQVGRVPRILWIDVDCSNFLYSKLPINWIIGCGSFSRSVLTALLYWALCLAFLVSMHTLTIGQLLFGAWMKPIQRARCETAKLEREVSILTATEILLRQSGYDSMTMQAVATAAGLAKGTLYLYFTSRESLVLAVYGRLFDRWIDRFALHQLELNTFDGFCRDFARHYADDPLFLQLAGFANALLAPQLDREAYIKSKRGMALRVKKLAGLVYKHFSITPVAAQKLIWGFLTIAGGAAQMMDRSPVNKADLPDDVIAFIGLANFETIFVNAAEPLGVNFTIR